MEYNNLLFLLTLLFIIKNYEVICHVTGQLDIQDPDILGALLRHLDPNLRHQPLIDISPTLAHDPSINVSPQLNIDPQLVLPQAPKPILLDTSDDEDDDWLSLLHFLIVALKNKKHGYNPYKGEIHQLEDSLRHRGIDIGKEKTIHINIGNENSRSNTETNIVSHTSSNSESHHVGHSSRCCCGKHHDMNNGCGCIFIPYPIAIPMNFPTKSDSTDIPDPTIGVTSNDTNDSETDSLSTIQQPCTVREPSEICVTIRTD